MSGNPYGYYKFGKNGSDLGDNDNGFEDFYPGDGGRDDMMIDNNYNPLDQGIR